ncbi:plasmid partitioning protein RepB [Rhizobium sp. S96]|uniref:plasmid partitioning protein RepB n=1 Tax=Rhizobium sp. S96 TaxID=3055140 RepID=UPI0025AB588F|nr:plasmid partitioning protein RepB [Rhizobium sp. S96]MDM9623907.1 plasmid partitioning protein RepB [Rhizobium sp. S96]
MNKRTQSIRSMFAGQSDGADAGEQKRPTLSRVTSGAVRSLKDTFSDVEREYEALRAQLATGQVAIEIDPALIDPSPLADRFVEQDAATFDALKTSISERGQEIPVLVRQHPTIAGRFQSAYGHRRVRAARELGLPVKAYLRPLSDEDLVVAQGLENSAREDLSFIERAVFAARLEDAGFQRALIQTALSVDRAEVSKLIAVSRALSREIVDAIGRAPKIGRGRWQALADALKTPGASVRVAAAMASAKLGTKATDDRFIAVLSAANAVEEDKVPASSMSVVSLSGEEIGKVSMTSAQWRLSVNRAKNDGFAGYLAAKLPALYDAYREAEQAGKDGAEH